MLRRLETAMVRFARPLVACAAVIGLALSACGARNYSYQFHKPAVSQDQLLRDEEDLRKTGGVERVHSIHHLDGSGTLDLAVDENERVRVQQKLSQMGYIRGQH